MATTDLVKGARARHTTVALKLAMAASGIVFILFVLLHMYGNLKALAGEQSFNDYAHHLREFGEPMLPYGGLLWIIRIVLLVSLIVHVASAISLAKRASAARTVKYAVKKNKHSSFSSRTMRWGGVTLLVFIIWHLFNFTIIKVNPAGGPTNNPYELLYDTFDLWWMTLIYLIAMLALGMHLHHGTWSSLQTLGLTNSPAARAKAKLAGWVIAIVIAGGFSLVPLAVLTGLIEK